MKRKSLAASITASPRASGCNRLAFSLHHYFGEVPPSVLAVGRRVQVGVVG